MPVIAFIGLGNMGAGMAANLVKAGHMVQGFDLSEAAMARAAAHGIAGAGSIGAAVTGADAVITMLQTGEQARGVYDGEVFAAAPPATILIDCSTIDVTSARAVGEAAAGHGHEMVDAPVSGGVAGAVAGTLTFMVGGTEKGFAMAQPILAAMGKAVLHAGGAGAGQAAKICNNMLLGASMIATAETFNMALKQGLDPQVFFDISSKASGQCWSLSPSTGSGRTGGILRQDQGERGREGVGAGSDGQRGSGWWLPWCCATRPFDGLRANGGTLRRAQGAWATLRQAQGERFIEPCGSACACACACALGSGCGSRSGRGCVSASPRCIAALRACQATEAIHHNATPPAAQHSVAPSNCWSSSR